MRLMKPVLIVLLLFATASLVLIVYSAKNKFGMFGKIYDNFVLAQTQSRVKIIRERLDSIYQEVKTLSADQTVRSVFVSASLGDNTSRYQDNFQKIVDALKDCRKIQVVDSTGRVIYSTLESEINDQRIIPGVFQKMKSYFTENDYIFLPPVGTNEIVALYPAGETAGQGYVAVYYSRNRLLQGNRKDLAIPVIRDNFFFLAAPGTVITNSLVNRIIDHYSRPDSKPSDNKSPTAAGIGQYRGIKIVNYSKNELFSPYFWLTFVVLVVNFLLIGAIVFALIRSSRGDMAYKNIRLSSFDRELETPKAYPSFHPAGDEIQDLVTDIESNRGYEEKVARRGIEDMILKSDVSVPEEPPQEKVDMIEEPMPLGDQDLQLKPSDLDLAEESFAPGPIPERSGTELFAEQERILEGVDNRVFEENLDFEKPDAGSVGGTPEIDIVSPRLEVSEVDTSSIEAVEPPPVEMGSGEESVVPFAEETVEIPSVSLDEEHPVLKETPAEFEIPDLEVPKSAPGASDDDFRISLGGEDLNIMARPGAEEIVLTPDTGAGEEAIPDITPHEEIIPIQDVPEVEIPASLGPKSAGAFEAPAIPLEALGTPETSVEPETRLEETEAFTAEKVDAVVKLSPQEYEKKMRKVFVEPPVRLSKITSVKEYGQAAMDIAKSSLNINKVLVLEKKGDRFQAVLNRGFETKTFNLDMKDPVYQMFLREKKSLDITGHIGETRYLKEKFGAGDIRNVEEFFIMPIINRESIDGIAMFAREKGTPAPTNFQRSELFNMGYLQEV